MATSNPWTYLVLWAKGPEGWFAFDQTTVRRMTRSEAVAALWKLRALWGNYKDPVSIFQHDGVQWKTAAVQWEPMKPPQLALA